MIRPADIEFNYAKLCIEKKTPYISPKLYIPLCINIIMYMFFSIHSRVNHKGPQLNSFFPSGRPCNASSKQTSRYPRSRPT